MQIYLHIYGEAVRYGEAQRGTANFRSLRHVRSVAKVNSASYRGKGGWDSNQDASIPAGRTGPGQWIAGIQPRCDYVGAN